MAADIFVASEGHIKNGASQQRWGEEERELHMGRGLSSSPVYVGRRRGGVPGVLDGSCAPS